jgi:hypothetical protein
VLGTGERVGIERATLTVVAVLMFDGVGAQEDELAAGDRGVGVDVHANVLLLVVVVEQTFEVVLRLGACA